LGSFGSFSTDFAMERFTRIANALFSGKRSF
jgi:hypothetical protein